jgi:hypothetical protein
MLVIARGEPGGSRSSRHFPRLMGRASRWDLRLGKARGWKEGLWRGVRDAASARHVSTQRFGIRLPASRNRGAPLLAFVARECWADAGCLLQKSPLTNYDTVVGYYCTSTYSSILPRMTTTIAATLVAGSHPPRVQRAVMQKGSQIPSLTADTFGIGNRPEM